MPATAGLESEDYGHTMAAFYDTFHLSRKQPPTERLANLYRRPPAETTPARIDVAVPNAVHQADLLELPRDRGHRYALVVADLATRAVDAQPLRSKSADAVAERFARIYPRHRLAPPTARLEVDDGHEWYGAVSRYFADRGVIIRRSEPGRTRQQGLVEAANRELGKALHQRMAAQELLTGRRSVRWIDDLATMVDALNMNWLRAPPPLESEPPTEPRALDLLAEGTRVRRRLDRPQEVTGRRLPGAFRASDVRWDPSQRTVRQLILRPGQPPLYLLDGQNGRLAVSRAAYTREQLQVIPAGERDPPATVVRPRRPARGRPRL